MHSPLYGIKYKYEIPQRNDDGRTVDEVFEVDL
jgi:hypothetical protein